jgi:hypothetical protein
MRKKQKPNTKNEQSFHPRHLARSIARSVGEATRAGNVSMFVNKNWRTGMEGLIGVPGQKYLYPQRRDSMGRIRKDG